MRDLTLSYPEAYVNLANIFFYEGEPTRAIELLTRAITLNPKHPYDWNLVMMGLAYFMRGDNDAAIEWLQKCLEKNPTLSHARAYLAMAYASKGDDALAHTAAAEVQRLNPNTKLSAFDNPKSSSPTAYREFYENRLAPAWRKAGLPE